MVRAFCSCPIWQVAIRLHFHHHRHHLDHETRTMDEVSSKPPASSPSTLRWVLGFLLVGAAWGFTTPLMRRAAISKEQKPQPARPFLTDPNVSWIKRKTWGIAFAVVDLLKNPAYAIPLLLNVTGSVWFFLLIGQAGRFFQS